MIQPDTLLPGEPETQTNLALIRLGAGHGEERSRGADVGARVIEMGSIACVGGLRTKLDFPPLPDREFAENPKIQVHGAWPPQNIAARCASALLWAPRKRWGR